MKSLSLDVHAVFVASFAAAVLALQSPTAQKASDTMKAVRIHDYGESSVLVCEDAPRPTPADDELLVRVIAAGVNPVDDKIRSGDFKEYMKLPLPFVLGGDVAGVVESVGKKVSKFKAGDAVFAYVSLQRGGGYAEYAIAKESETALKAAKQKFVDAAAMPIAALTAWQALVDNAKLASGQTVLIHGAAGGVGSYAVQIAKSIGAKVIATGSTESQGFLKELGADVAIDYSKQKFEELAKDVDVVLDPIGGDTQTRSIATLKKGGILVSIVQPPDQAAATAAGVRATIFLAHPDANELASLAKLVDSGKLKSIVSKTYALCDAAKAHDQIHTGHTRGKLVLEVAKEPADAKQK